MNPTAIYSKSGKGVQEASGKTSHLPRGDRAVLSAIDGRATLADVAQKVGKTFDPAFEKLIGEMDKSGFIREVSPGTAAPASKAGAGTGAKPGAKPSAPTAPMDAGEDLDFTAAMSAAPKGKPQPPPQAPPRAAPPPRPSAPMPPPPPPPSAAEKAKAEQVAQSQQDTFAKAREEAERKAQAERDRVKAESEAKVRAETEGKLRAEAEAKAKADAEARLAADAAAKIKAAQDAAARVAAEAKAKAEAETRKAREEADRVRRETEEKLRREQEEMKRKLEEERKAREEAERKAKEEARRLEEERRKLEEERKRREEERKREEAERAAQRKREDEEREARRKREAEEEAAQRAERKKREEEEEAREKAERQKRADEEAARESAEKAMRDARRKMQERQEEEEEERERAERAARRKSDEPDEEEEKPKKKKKKEEKAPEPAKPAGGGGFSDTLLADLDSFTTREENDQKEQAEAERKAKEEKERRRREEEERRAKEDAERAEREAKERKKREEQEAKRHEEEDLKEKQRREEQRLHDEEEKRKKEADERERKSKQDEVLTAKSIGRGAGDAFSAEAELRKRRERQLGPAHRDPKVAERAKGGWGKPIALVLFLLLAIGVGVVHVMPIGTEEYERAATDALGRPVKISSAGLSLFTGLQLKFSGVAIGETKIATVRAYPEFGALTGPKKAFNRIEIEGLKLPQEGLGDSLFTKVKADNFSVERLVFKQLELTGPLALPKGMEVELIYDAEGALRAATVRGPEALAVKVVPKGSSIEFDMTASSFTLPFAAELSMSKFTAKGSVGPQGMSVSEWEGQILNGTVSGTANVRWADGYAADGVITARNINAAVFAPALLSDGRAEGSGKFVMRGTEPAKLASTGGRLDGSFTVSRGVLGSIDLSRAIQTGGKQATGRTQFNEMNGQAVYNAGTIALRSVTLTAGQLNAGASVDIAANGALSGRIVADVKVGSQTLRANLNLGGTLKEPQVRN